MQRWIVFGVVAVLLVLGGGGIAYKNYKQNRPHPVWVPLPINPELPGEKRTELARELKAKLEKPALLLQVSKDLNLPQALGVATDEAAASEVAGRLFVTVGEADSPAGGKIPSINIGVKGKDKEQVVSGKIAMRLMQDVWKILGIKPPAQR
ncbi:hypothetical protein HQ447_19875 [bacterium]|nr:hypothetical protein [bacterium]